MSDRFDNKRPDASFGDQVRRIDPVLARQNAARDIADFVNKYGEKAVLTAVGIVGVAVAVYVGVPALAEQFGR